MESSDLLLFTVRAIERTGLRYLVTGSVATIFYGEPRFTNDIDIVVDLPPDKVKAFCAQFPAPEFYVSEDSARQAVRDHSQFNILHAASGLKVDVIVPDRSPFNQLRFARARRVMPDPALEAMFASPEDVILKKLCFYQEGGSEKHLRDIASILRISADRIDREYIVEWATKLGVSESWKEVLRRAGSGSSS